MNGWHLWLWLSKNVYLYNNVMRTQNRYGEAQFMFTLRIDAHQTSRNALYVIKHREITCFALRKTSHLTINMSHAHLEQ